MTDDPAMTPRPETSLSARPDRAGTALIKPEYLLHPTPLVDNSSTAALNSTSSHLDVDDEAEGRSSADPREGKKRKKDKSRTGQNKARSFPVIREAVRICRSWETTGSCNRPVCKFAHDWSMYLSTRPEDVHFEPDGRLQDQEPYVVFEDRKIGGEEGVGKTLDLNTTCPVYKDLGYCPFGWRCRFLGGHVRRITEGKQVKTSEEGEWQLVGGQKADEKVGWKFKETNWPDGGVLHRLRTNTYDYPFSSKYLHLIEPDKQFTLTRKRPNRSGEEGEANNQEGEEEAMNAMEQKPEIKGLVDGEAEALDVPLRPEEKRRLNWEGGLYLAPLTTVGNLPFRRLCISYGATITCSEMALAQPLIFGQQDEWALVRRHETERMFGVQLAGGYPNRLVPAAEVVRKELGQGVDFVDVNLGCPIDLVFNQGAGSALLDSPGRLGKILVGMNRALGDIPLTVKFRTGVANGKPTAHKLIPRFATEWGVGAMTLHGRSRQQRYSKLADWQYIKTCASILRESLSEANLPPVPIFGNGDCFSSQSYWQEVESSGVDGVMVARGALIKPWIFTEISERREWDITGVERLEGLRKFTEYGLSHWGSDTQGINTTRRFLLEALSFQHRYIPLGLLEILPGKLNERPPAFKGRTELETLLSSPFVGDWIKISEMFLGKVDDGFKFLPKHKSNSYGGEESQG
ncbi:tRNA-dihydrouridine synthase 3 [Tremella mesenterica]|uniref:tRNA-dihydrouridine(47) synthase [NAD(P)(+)] n=1 Tax=Tremella mesenterica TaxID=5217 RepID=A0A4Q1BG27_TREME|nr:tRNA-dihydrouridine synthase 3 [Tremella mesenterica]